MRRGKPGVGRVFLAALLGALLGAAACRTYDGARVNTVVIYDHTDGVAARCTATGGTE